jgi:hypothetical protein
MCYRIHLRRNIAASAEISSENTIIISAQHLLKLRLESHDVFLRGTIASSIGI